MSTTYLRTALDDATFVGGKAASLARLKGLSLAVPQAFVVTDDLLRALLSSAPVSAVDPRTVAAAVAQAYFPSDFEPQLQKALATLGASRFSVRSSFALEDEPDALAAGVYESFLDVRAQDVPQAVRDVLRSAFSAAAVAYAQARNRDVMQGPYAVLIHPYITHRAHGHAALHVSNVPQIWVREGALNTAQRQDLEQALERLVATCGSSEVEWITHEQEASERLLFVQWRPYKPPPAREPWHPTGSAPGPHLMPGLLAMWTWDAAHNPHPLSPAQQYLVALVQAQCRVGFDQRTLGGYLFYKAAPDRPAPVWPAEEVTTRFALLAHEVAQGLAQLSDPPPLQSALTLFLTHYEALVGSCGAALKRGRLQLREFLSQHLPEALHALPDLLTNVPSAASRRRDVLLQVMRATEPGQKQEVWRQYIEAFGDEATAWDVVAPTHRETLHPPELADDPSDRNASARSLRFVEARDQVLGRLPSSLHRSFAKSLELARTCVGLAEDDDALYARMQAPIRYALLSLGRRWHEQGVMQHETDVFFVPLDRVVSASDSQAALLAREVPRARALWQQQHHNPPPAMAVGTPNKQPLQGHGTGGRAVGRVLIHRGGPPPQAPHHVVLATSLLPTELPLIAAAALVTATGGPLDHVAAQARERGLIAVVGVADVFEHVREGDIVLVDADAGLVRRLSRS